MLTRTPDIFRQITFLELRGIVPSVSRVVDMLELRRHPDRDVRLKECNLVALQCNHQAFTNDEVVNFQARTAALRAHTRARPYPNWSIWTSLNDLQPGPDGPLGPLRRHLHIPWIEGMQQDPTQVKRIEKLQAEGLELWMDPRSTVDSWLNALRADASFQAY
ncbi:hypothetical protein BDV98DRAFT_573809, partial [Pterulicium gracile]